MAVIVLDDGNVTEGIPLDKLGLITVNMRSDIYLGFRYWEGFQRHFKRKALIYLIWLKRGSQKDNL